VLCDLGFHEIGMSRAGFCSTENGAGGKKNKKAGTGKGDKASSFAEATEDRKHRVQTADFPDTTEIGISPQVAVS